MAGPFDVDQYLEDTAVDLSALSYSANGVRRQPIKDELATKLRQAVTAVYGPDYRVDIMSAAQPSGPRGTKGTTGSRRHGTGVAADVWVYAPDGRRLAGDELVPLSQHWLGTKAGSVGFPARAGQSLHLDLIGGSGPGAVPLGKGEGRLWYYGTPSQSQRSALNQSLTKGTTPKYAVAPETVAKGLIPPSGMMTDRPIPSVMPPTLRQDWANANAPRPSVIPASLRAPASTASLTAPSIPSAYDSPSTKQQVASLYEGILPARKSALPSFPGSSVAPRLVGNTAFTEMGVPDTTSGFVPFSPTNRMGTPGRGALLDQGSFSPATRNPVPQSTPAVSGNANVLASPGVRGGGAVSLAPRSSAPMPMPHSARPLPPLPTSIPQTAAEHTWAGTSFGVPVAPVPATPSALTQLKRNLLQVPVVPAPYTQAQIARSRMPAYRQAPVPLRLVIPSANPRPPIPQVSLLDRLTGAANSGGFNGSGGGGSLV